MSNKENCSLNYCDITTIRTCFLLMAICKVSNLDFINTADRKPFNIKYSPYEVAFNISEAPSRVQSSVVTPPWGHAELQSISGLLMNKNSSRSPKWERARTNLITGAVSCAELMTQ